MILVAGYLTICPGYRDAFVARSTEAVRCARRVPGCLDFSVSADAVDIDRVNVSEAWASRKALEAFRGSGPDDGLATLVERWAVAEHEVPAPSMGARPVGDRADDGGTPSREPGPSVAIRPGRPDDRDAVLALVPRLAATGTPPRRDSDEVAATAARTVGAALGRRGSGSALLVAEHEQTVLGFVHMTTVTDYYTQQRIGHVSDLVVAEGAEGRGVGRALMAAGEAWARGQGYPVVQLYVLVGNDGARALYERLGFTAEWLKYVRPLEPATSPGSEPTGDAEAPRSPVRPIGWWLKQADALLTERVDEALRACGLTRLEWQALNAVRDGEDGSAALRPFGDAAWTGEVLATLEARGMTASAGGRPGLTDEGASLYDRAMVVQRGVRERSMAGITPDEYAATVAVLERLVTNLAEPGSAGVRTVERRAP